MDFKQSVFQWVGSSLVLLKNKKWKDDLWFFKINRTSNIHVKAAVCWMVQLFPPSYSIMFMMYISISLGAIATKPKTVCPCLNNNKGSSGSCSVKSLSVTIDTSRKLNDCIQTGFSRSPSGGCPDGRCAAGTPWCSSPKLHTHTMTCYQHSPLSSVFKHTVNVLHEWTTTVK